MNFIKQNFQYYNKFDRNMSGWRNSLIFHLRLFNAQFFYSPKRSSHRMILDFFQKPRKNSEMKRYRPHRILSSSQNPDWIRFLWEKIRVSSPLFTPLSLPPKKGGPVHTVFLFNFSFLLEKNVCFFQGLDPCLEAKLFIS